MAKQTKGALLIKKKLWTPIMAPAIFDNKPIGEIYLEDAQTAIGRKITVSMMILTGDPQRQNVLVSFKIIKAENNQLQTEIIGFAITPVAVRKMMRRGRERISDSFVVKTKDGIALRIKPVLITRGRAKGGVTVYVRKHLRVNILRAVTASNYIDFIQDLISHKFQSELRQKLSKIYPLQICELRDVKIETSEKALKKVINVPAAPAPVAEPPAEAPAEQTA